MESNPLSSLNKKHQEFWSEQTKLRDQRLEYQELASRLHLDESWLPIYYRPSFERMLGRAEEITKECQKRFSEKGARAKKSDPLTPLIEEIVQNQPVITEPELLRYLKRHERVSPIQEVTDEEIILEKGNAKLKAIPISGLKDRLSRVKKSMR